MISAVSNGQIAVDATFTGLCIIAVALRFVARTKRKLSYQLDDFFILAALAVGMGVGALGIYGATKNTNSTNVVTMGIATWNEHQKILFIDLLLCHTLYTFAKLSILFFFKRIFVGKKFVIALNLLIALVVSWYITAVVGQLVVKTPISTWWTLNGLAWQKYGRFNFNIWLLVMACIDMVLDIAVFALPIPLIARLHMTTARKVQVSSVFSVALFCVVSSAIRVYWSYILWQITADAKSVNHNVLSSFENDIWAHVEGYIAIITACLPTLGPLLPSGRSFESILHSIRSKLSVSSLRQGARSGASSGSIFQEKNNGTTSYETVREKRNGSTAVGLNSAAP